VRAVRRCVRIVRARAPTTGGCLAGFGLPQVGESVTLSVPVPVPGGSPSRERPPRSRRRWRPVVAAVRGGTPAGAALAMSRPAVGVVVGESESPPQPPAPGRWLADRIREACSEQKSKLAGNKLERTHTKCWLFMG
jgi:hypothetical protein